MIKIRCDDFDTRIDLKTLKPLHEEFVKRGIPMTVAVNNAMGGGYGHNPEVIKYVNETDPASWDIQLHGYEHERYWTFSSKEMYRDIFANLYITKHDFIHSDPKIFYPPWNETSEIMFEVCKKLGLEVNSARRTIREFLTWYFNNKESEKMYVWHWWTKDDRDILPQALDKLLIVNKNNGSS